MSPERDGPELAWFRGAFDCALDRALQPWLEERRQEFRNTQKIAALAYNGSAPPFGDKIEIVLFPNGEEPTQDPHNLPPLTSLVAIRALRANEQRAYYEGYYGEDAPRRQNRRIAAILNAIGRRGLAFRSS
ncbi:hypothetical protein BS17DRAFT_816412 [Gyrodon lividus]|nr:hypothetical protein BS17DRAFT_816412 [Gyrodon lividus]